MTAPVDLPRLTALLERATWKTGASIQEVCDGTTARGELLNYDHYLPALIAELTAARERLAELERAIEGAIKDVEQGNLYSTMCCSGHECGCRGSSYADLLVHDLRATLQPENPND